jgi:hypothetical protein
MIISDPNNAIANELRKLIHKQTDTVSDGQGIAMMLLWSFFMDHAIIHELDIEDLARTQLEAFIEYARTNVKLVREH